MGCLGCAITSLGMWCCRGFRGVRRAGFPQGRPAAYVLESRVDGSREFFDVGGDVLVRVDRFGRVVGEFSWVRAGEQHRLVGVGWGVAAVGAI